MQTRANLINTYGEETRDGDWHLDEFRREDEEIGDNQPLSPFTKQFARQVMYVNQMDSWGEGISKDFDDKTWEAEEILNHDGRLHPKNGWIDMIQVRWKNDEKSWVTMESIRQQDPKRLILYAAENNLLENQSWTWVMDYLKSGPSKIEVAR